MNYLFISISAVVAFIVTIILFIPIIKKVKTRNLLLASDDSTRKPFKMVPFGGVAIFAGIMFASVVGLLNFHLERIVYVLIAVFAFFIVGIFQELKETTQWKKFVLKILVALFIIVFGNIRITQFHNVFGMDIISDFLSYPLSFVFVLFTISAYSLSSKTDKLIIGLGSLASVSFGIWFFAAHQLQYASLAFALFGCLLAFYTFNAFNVKRKMILGETGMQIIGLLVAVMAIVTNEFDTSHSFQPMWVSNPVFVFAIIGIPIIEIVRKFILRLILKQSFFSSDSNHIYYEIYRVTKNHTETTSILVLFSIIMIFSSVILNIVELHVYYQLVVLFVELLLLYSFTFSYFRKKYRKFRRRRI